MNSQETAKILTVLQVNYPDSFRDMSDLMVKARVKLWHDVFRDDKYEDVNMAVIAFVATDTNRFMPPAGVIKNMLVKIRLTNGIHEDDVVGEIVRAVRNGIYGHREEFEKLSPPARKLVGSAAQLREWAMMDGEVFQSVVVSNLRKSCRVLERREKEQLALPGDVREAMMKITGNIQLPELEDGGAYD